MADEQRQQENRQNQNQQQRQQSNENQRQSPQRQNDGRPQHYERRWHGRERSRDRGGDNTVFIGKKPSMAYVLAVVTQLTSGQNEIHIKARGRAISKAVDVAEIVRNKFVQDAKVGEIKIGTEEVQAENEKLNISTMEITLRK